MLDGLHRDPGESPLKADVALIARFFAGPSLVRIIEDLERADGTTKAWAEATLADLRTRSPLSLQITDRHIRSARALDLRATLEQDYRIAARCLDGHDFIEGVRAALIDKDHQPKWQHARIEDVTAAEIDAYFAPLGADELALPTREDMQAARV
jgi:enoyl-CoA hydratase